ncbi:hypothetical protein BV898_04703 [Hypsibius exemplaris]|uniref:Ionotropic glutamate receptor C-terminal domain-containing protein n=1 Tax=Hypsibius exemplaris TaxID=2072580 RepID=A0A1W0X1Z1_HYPEX|nr:hypothetical protein BV898_04703 [Hypsibius exemplaris]
MIPTTTLHVALDPSVIDETFQQEALHLMCRRLRFECSIKLVNWSWGSGLGFPGLYDAIFQNVTERNVSFVVGLSHLAVTPERIAMASLINSGFDLDFIIVVDEKDLVPVSGETFFATLFGRIANGSSWAIMSAVFGIFVLLIVIAHLMTIRSDHSRDGFKAAQHFAGLLHRLWQATFDLFAVTIGQEQIFFHRLSGRSVVFIFTLWFLWATIALAVVGGLLPYLQTVTTTMLPFTSLGTLLKSNYTLIGGALEAKVLNESSDPLSQQLAREMIVLPQAEVDGENVSVLQLYKLHHPDSATALMTQNGFETQGFFKVPGCPSTISAIHQY